MTRKRFIKLLMAHGYSRNQAVIMAEYYRSRNIPYNEAYATPLLSNRRAIRRFNKAMRIAINNAVGNIRMAFNQMSSRP